MVWFGGCRPCSGGVADYEAEIGVSRVDGVPLPDGTPVRVYAYVNGERVDVGVFRVSNGVVRVVWRNAPPMFDLVLEIETPWRSYERLLISGVINCCNVPRLVMSIGEINVATQ